MNTIYFVNALASPGKTYQMARKAHSQALRGEWVLIVQPTLALINEAAAEVRGLIPAVPPEVIHGENAENVTAAILAALKARPAGGRVLFITWSGFLGLPFFQARQFWTVFVDEIPQVAKMDDLNLSRTHAHLTDHVELIPKGPVWGVVCKKNRNAIRRLAESQDDLLKVLVPVALTLLSVNWRTYVRIEGFAALLKGKGQKLTFHSVLRPQIFDGFKRVTILGANFTHSLLYKLWSIEGVDFEEDQALTGQLRFTEHPNGNLVTIHYAIEEPWSKSVRDRQDQAILKRMVKAVDDRMNGHAYAWIANKDILKSPFASPDAICLPQVSHGLNTYQHLDHVVFLSARLPSPDHFGFLLWLGITDDEVRRATYFEPVYQTVMRSSLRDPENLSPKTVIVPDRQAAEFIRDLFPGSTIQKLDIDLNGIVVQNQRGRKRKHKDGNAKVQHLRQKNKDKINELANFMVTFPGSFTMIHGPVTATYGDDRPVLCNENPVKGNNVTKNALGSIFDHTHATHPMYIVNEIGIDLFIEVLQNLSKRKIDNKHQNALISPAIFDPDLSSDTSRGLANVVYANGIWLDCEHGDMIHRDLASIFPHVRMVAFNSFSSTKREPRFRVYIPTSRTMSAEEYKFIFEQIVQVVKDAGFRLKKKDRRRPNTKAHGIDLGKGHAASLFYLPCLPEAPKARIWKNYKGPERLPLDVDDWLENPIPVETDDYEPKQVEVETDDRDDRPVDQARVDRALDEWNSSGSSKGNGDAGLWHLFVELRAAGLPHHEVGSMLLDAARWANSPKDRERQALRIIKVHRW